MNQNCNTPDNQTENLGEIRLWKTFLYNKNGVYGGLRGFSQFSIGRSATQSLRISCIAIHAQIWQTVSTVVLEKDDFDLL